MAIIKTVKQSVFIFLAILLSLGCFFTVTDVFAAGKTEESFEDLVKAANNDSEILDNYLNDPNSPYFKKFDYVSLFDLNLGNSVEVPTGGEAFTNTPSNTLENIYAVSNQNLTGSVVFRFKYTWKNAQAAENAEEKYNAQLRIKLRGNEWNGHTFKIGEVNPNGTNSIQVESIGGSGWLGGTDRTFISGETYEIELGAVDLLNSDRTWLFMKFDGQYIANFFADTLSYGTNRVDISTRWESSVKPSDSEKLPSIRLAQSGEQRSYENVGLQDRFSFADEMSSPTSLSLTMHDNDYETGDYYPASDSVVTYNGKPASINTEPCLQKTDGTHYVLNLSQEIEPKEDDKLKIEGVFLHYDAEHSIKQALATRAVSFTFTGGKWVQNELPFSELQSDAQYMLDEYLVESFLALYDATERETIKNIVAESKEAIAAATDEAVLNAADGRTKAIFLCSPNNPTGNNLDREAIYTILRHFDGIVVIDEAYIDFSASPSFVGELADFPNLIVLQTLSKAWGAAAIRLGMAFAAPELIAVLNKIKYPYNVNLLTQEKALELLGDTGRKDRQVKEILAERERLAALLSEPPFSYRVYPSDANFLLVDVGRATAMYEALVEKGVVVRNRDNVRMCHGCLRVTIGTREENDILLNALKECK